MKSVDFRLNNNYAFLGFSPAAPGKKMLLFRVIKCYDIRDYLISRLTEGKSQKSETRGQRSETGDEKISRNPRH